MKLFSKKRLQINESIDAITVKWWALGFWDIVFLFLLPITLVYGVSEYLGYKEVLGGFEIVSLNATARSVLWVLVSLMSLQLIFNRRVTLLVSNTSFVYKKGFIPGKKIDSPLTDVTSISIESYEDPIAESPTGTDITDYRVVIIFRNGRKKKIKGLSEEDAKRIEILLQKQREKLV